MGRLLRYEFRKLFKQTSFIVCLILSIVFTALIGNFLVIALMNAMDEYPDFTMDRILQSIGCNSTDILLIVLVTIFVCSDFGNRVIKNIIGRGYTRSQVYVASFLVTVFIAVFLSVVSLGTSLIYNAIGSYPMEFDTKTVLILLEQVLGQILYASLYFFFAFLIKKTGTAILINIVVPSTLNMGVSLMTYFIDKYELPDVTKVWAFNYVNTLWSTSVSTEDMVKFAVLAVVYIAVFFMAGFLLFRKQDV